MLETGKADFEPGIVKPEKKTFALPPIESAQVIVDQEQGVLWVGLPLRKMEQLEAVVMLDQAKSHVLGWFKETGNQRRSQIVKAPGIFNQALAQTKSFLAGKGR